MALSGGIHGKIAGEAYYHSDYNTALSYVLDRMIIVGLDTGSFTNQQDAYFNLFSTDSAGSSSNMTYGAGSYRCNSGGSVQCMIRSVAIPVHYSTAGSSLQAFWPFNQTTLGSDVINTNHGSLVGPTQVLSFNKFGSAYGFDGTNDFIHIMYHGTIGTNQFTVAGWVNHQSNPSANTVHTIISTDRGANIVGGWQLDIDSTGSLITQIQESGGQRNHNVGSGIALGSWIHFAYTFNGTTLSGYVNGSLGSTYNISGTFTRNGSAMEIGCRDSSGGTAASFYLGSVDEVGYWSRALTQAEIQYMINSGRGVRHMDFNGSVTSVISRWIGSFSSGVTITNQISLNNGTNWTDVLPGTLGSISPSTGSLMLRLLINRVVGTELDKVESLGVYYG